MGHVVAQSLQESIWSNVPNQALINQALINQVDTEHLSCKPIQVNCAAIPPTSDILKGDSKPRVCYFGADFWSALLLRKSGWLR